MKGEQLSSRELAEIISSVIIALVQLMPETKQALVREYGTLKNFRLKFISALELIIQNSPIRKYLRKLARMV